MKYFDKQPDHLRSIIFNFYVKASYFSFNSEFEKR